MRTPLRRTSCSALAALALAAPLAAGPVALGAAPGPPVAVAAKTCSSGYTHAVIGGEQKCLRRGEFCAHRYNAQYHRYGFSCTKRDSRGDYHLT